MKLTDRIAALGLSPTQCRRLRDELTAVAEADGHVRPEERRLIDRLAPSSHPPADPAPLDSMWRHGEVLVVACIYVAVADGEYGVEEARTISALAHRLGLSAARLGEIEKQTFAELAERAAR